VKDEEILSLARKRMTTAISAYSDSREDELDDMRFTAGNSDNSYQWPQDVLQTRGSVQGQTINSRPCITINKLPQHVKQVTNDQRQNRPSGKVIPADNDADVEVAEVFDGIIRHIEYISDADVAYDTACENQVTFGEGYWRILTEYCDDQSFEQEIKLGRIRNSFKVFMDPLIQDPCGADANWCFVVEDLLKDDFERLYPEATPISSLLQQSVGDMTLGQWIVGDTVRVADYYYVEHATKTLNRYGDKSTALVGSPEAKMAQRMGMPITATRSVDVKTIKACKTNGYEILDSKDWAGKYIPVIRVIGNEFEIDGRIEVSGLVRNAKDAQRMYNYWTSQEAEMLALAPKAPFIGYGGQFEGYEAQWKTANTTAWPYLEVNPDVTDGQGSPLPLPQRSQPPMASSGLLQAKMGAADDIKSTTGQYDTSLGATSNERSGKAIMARERQSDTGTYHYVDNFARAVRYSTRQMVDLIPKIYDSQRIARIVGIDGESKSAMIDPNQPQAVRKITDEEGAIKKIYNPGVGKYDVRVTTGPGYLTKRQESLESMSQLLQAAPQLWAVAGDLFIKNMDWPGADEIAARFAKTIDPKLLATDEIPPELAAAQKQIQDMGQQMEQMQGMLQNVQKSVEMRDLERQDFEARIKAFDAETKRITATAAGMTPDQIQEIVMGTLHAAIDAGDIVSDAMTRNAGPMLAEPQPDAMPTQEQMPQQITQFEQMP
tara:strand:- start:5356 stop:7506 length:2151 start_codon:yes stop_codon:yes gene_type:complete